MIGQLPADNRPIYNIYLMLLGLNLNTIRDAFLYMTDGTLYFICVILNRWITPCYTHGVTLPRNTSKLKESRRDLTENSVTRKLIKKIKTPLYECFYGNVIIVVEIYFTI